jgi:hypothetical protein
MKPKSISGIVRDTAHETLCENIQAVYHRAVREGTSSFSVNWYANALRDCEAIAKTEKLPVRVVIGVVSALSPRMPWIWNLANAVRLIHGLTTTAYRANEAKGKRILAGESPLVVLGGLKTLAFFKNIRDAGTDDYHVTVDTWAVKVALGAEYYRLRISGVTPKQYKRIEAAYREVAEWVGDVNGCELQAITWHQIRIDCGFDDADWKVIDDFNPYS